ncbi:MAG: AraC family transcriptional regulator [Parvibaculum sp.]|uniref:helix-turn-helix transcriptional regulator n=1 Tax=Parvibaculum sp. TaxID=2024848 RepID=UPI0025CCA16F|nr:AraC family transcriptional regulator [Parvibaculum sp.]MCE9649438.1 AraC family transcriptional regulator [Parvibaculum sp.]
MSDEKTSSGLLALVIGALRAEAPELLPLEPVMPDCALAHASGALKRQLLDKALAARGPDFILAMGQGVKQAGFEPLLHVLLQSETPAVLFGKWQRFEQFTHSSRRTALVAATESSLTLRRHSRSPRPPGRSENLLIAGVLAALLEEIGVSGLRIEWETGGKGGASFAFHWTGFAPKRRPVPRDIGRARERLTFYAADETARLTRRVVALLARDVGRDWLLAEIAQALNLSTRTLQRRLTGEGTSLSAISRAVRIREACHLLSGSRLELTEIGYWCGFSDSPHFSREFRRALGMPPTVYRRTAA